MSGRAPKEKTASESGESSEPTITPTSGKFQQLQHDMGVALSHGISSNNRLDRIEKLIENFVTTMIRSQTENSENIKVLTNNVNALILQIGKMQNKPEKLFVDADGDVIMTSYDVPSNHLPGGDPFKGKDTDVERFVSMCQRQFRYYPNFYSTETKRVEFCKENEYPFSLILK